MGRTVADVALMFDAEAGFHPQDPFSQVGPHPSFAAAAANSRKPARIAAATTSARNGMSSDGRAGGIHKGRAASRCAVIGKPRGESALFELASYLEGLFGVSRLTPIDPR
ncbi:MAG: hypothetical protein ACXWC1_04915 [Burkholderiales bacterium]